MGSTKPAFQGEALDLQLALLGQYRQPGESDWDFRKRVFPEIFDHDRRWAYEVLIGKKWSGFSPLEEALFQGLSLGKNPTKQELTKFANDWEADPQDLDL